MQEFKIKHVLNVTPKCPNHFEKEDLRYKRIAVSDTGSQKLSNYFLEAFQFIGKRATLLHWASLGIRKRCTCFQPRNVVWTKTKSMATSAHS